MQHLNKYKAAFLPFVGAVAGTFIAGPVGLAAGAKLGSIAAVGGGIGGRYRFDRGQHISLDCKSVSFR